MPEQNRAVRPHSKNRHVISSEGSVLHVPLDWELLPPGDAALTRRIKASGPCWIVMETKGRRQISRGIWADANLIETNRLKLLIERASPAYEKKLQANRHRRAKQQAQYESEFRASVLYFLNFENRYQSIAKELATRISDHATPVNSGTVARTQSIPIQERAEAATIAWMRHQTTAYDSLNIPRIKGKRREIRRRLAQQSNRLLRAYRQGDDLDPADCPLQKALSQ